MHKLFTLLLILIISACGQKNDSNSLVGHWSLDGNALDNSQYKSHGDVLGDPQIVKGVVSGNAYDFNGDDYIDISVNESTPPQIKDLETGTISLWFKARSWDINSTMLPILYYGSKDPCPEAFDGTNGGMIIEVGHGGIFPSENVFFTVYDQYCGMPTMCFDSHDGVGIIKPEQWYHFVVVVGEDYNTGYLNGKLLTDRRYNFQSEKTSLFFKDFVSHEKMWIGKGYWKSKEVYFDGLIDDIRIYNKPMTHDEVRILYKPKS